MPDKQASARLPLVSLGKDHRTSREGASGADCISCTNVGCDGAVRQVRQCNRGGRRSPKAEGAARARVLQGRRRGALGAPGSKRLLARQRLAPSRREVALGRHRHRRRGRSGRSLSRNAIVAPLTRCDRGVAEFGRLRLPRKSTSDPEAEASALVARLGVHQKLPRGTRRGQRGRPCTVTKTTLEALRVYRRETRTRLLELRGPFLDLPCSRVCAVSAPRPRSPAAALRERVRRMRLDRPSLIAYVV